MISLELVEIHFYKIQEIVHYRKNGLGQNIWALGTHMQGRNVPREKQNIPRNFLRQWNSFYALGNTPPIPWNLFLILAEAKI